MSELDFDARYQVDGYKGVAFWLKGYMTTPEYNMDLGEFETVIDHTMVEAVMVGDNRVHFVDVDDLTPIADEDYCHQCGQIGCCHDGR